MAVNQVMMIKRQKRHFTHLEVGVVVIRVFGLSDLHGHAWLLHELTSSERQTAQHTVAATLQHPLENLIMDEHNHITPHIQRIIRTHTAQTPHPPPFSPPSPRAASPPAALTCPGCTPCVRPRSVPAPPRSTLPLQASRPAARPARGGRTVWQWPD